MATVELGDTANLWYVTHMAVEEDKGICCWWRARQAKQKKKSVHDRPPPRHVAKESYDTAIDPGSGTFAPREAPF